MAFDTLTSALFIGVFVIAAIILLLVAWKLFKGLFKLAMAMIVNSIVGLIALGVLFLLGVKVPLTAGVIISIALFGLGGLGTILILMFFGVNVKVG
jgi:hypothetical protein